MVWFRETRPRHTLDTPETPDCRSPPTRAHVNTTILEFTLPLSECFKYFYLYRYVLASSLCSLLLSIRRSWPLRTSHPPTSFSAASAMLFSSRTPPPSHQLLERVGHREDRRRDGGGWRTTRPKPTSIGRLLPVFVQIHGQVIELLEI